MKKLFFIAALTGAVVLGACSGHQSPAQRPNDQDGVTKVCESVGPGLGEICICKTATEATECPA